MRKHKHQNWEGLDNFAKNRRKCGDYGVTQSKSQIYGSNVFDQTIRLNKFVAAVMYVYGSKCPYQLENGGSPGNTG